jgi:hypothetical protein
MARILVDTTGKQIQTLKLGERKLTTEYRVKLAPGDASEVATVRKIFELAAKPRNNPSAIARALNAKGVLSPGGYKWTHCSVKAVLRNAAYKGAAQIHISESDTFPCGATVTTENSWEAIVPLRTWEKGQRYFEDSKALRTADSLLETMRRSFAQGTADWRPYVERLKRNAPPPRVDHDAASSHWAKLCKSLAKRFQVESLTDRTVLLNGLLRLSYSASYPRLNQSYRLDWSFVAEDFEGADAFIGFGFSPAPSPKVQRSFLISVSRMKPQSRQSGCSMALNGRGSRLPLSDTEDLMRRLEHVVYRDGSQATAMFLAKLEGRTVVNAAEIARELGWPEAKGCALYAKLRREGRVHLPALKKQIHKRIAVVCEGCGLSRTMWVSNAMQYGNGRCWKCYLVAMQRFRVCIECGDRVRLNERGSVKLVLRRCPKCSGRINGKKARVVQDKATGRWVKAP